MELIDYIKIVKKNYFLIFIAILVVTAATGIITYYMPKTYTSQAILQSDIVFSIPGLKSVTYNEQQENRIYYYKAMVEESNFRNEVIKELAKDNIALASNDFNVSIRQLQQSKLAGLYVEIKNNRLLAKKVADTSAKLLVKKVDQLRDNPIRLKPMIEKKIKTLTGSLRKLRKQQQNVKRKLSAGGKAVNSQLYLMKDNIQDDVNTVLQKIQFFQDYHNRLSIEKVVAKKGLQIVYSANIPYSPIKPKMSTNLLFGAFAGFSLGLGLTTLYGKRDF